MTAVAARPPLRRSPDVVLSGVAAALARHLDRPIGVVRLILAALALLGGAGILLYAWLWALVPRERPDAPVSRRVPVAALLLGAAALAALLLLGRELRYGLPLGGVEAALLASAAIAWTLGVDARDPRHAGRAPLVRLLASGFLVVLGGALAALGFLTTLPGAAVLGLVDVLVGLAGFVVPVILDRAARRAEERAAAARREQRSEIAAHLHDSVLQTLAIIQNRAGAGSEVARIARAQERELRDWLFAGTDPFAGDLATELRTIARELELEHAVRIEVVAVGDVDEVESHAVAAAVREALVNAARHAGGEVTVYAEATPAAIEVFVRDRGPGFDPDAVPDGRLGIRESIVGRMARAGGTATVTSGEDGTEVHVRLPRRADGGAA